MATEAGQGPLGHLYFILGAKQAYWRKIGEGTMEDIFDGLQTPERVSMLESAEQKVFADGQTIVAENEQNSDIFAIIEGDVRVVVGSGDAATEVARLSEGAIFGEMSFLTHAMASASISADGKVELLCVSHNNIKAMIDNDPGFSGRFYRSLACTLAERLHRANQRR